MRTNVKLPWKEREKTRVQWAEDELAQARSQEAAIHWLQKLETEHIKTHPYLRDVLRDVIQGKGPRG